MKLFITGGSGFIGTRLIDHLNNNSNEIVNYDKVVSTDYPDLSILGDIRNYTQLQPSSYGCETIIHLAAEHRDDISPKSMYYDVNCEGTKNIIKAAVHNNINQIIFTSSVAIYGLNPASTDEGSVLKPFNDYGKSKIIAEKKLIEWANERPNRKLVIIRPTVIFGEGNHGNVYNLFKQINNKKFLMIGNGNNKKSIAYVANLVDFIIKTLNFENGIHIYNYADKPDYTMKEFITIISNKLDIKKSTFYLPKMIGLMIAQIIDILAILSGRKFNISKIRIKKFLSNSIISTVKLEHLGIEQKIPLKDAITSTLTAEFSLKSN